MERYTRDKVALRVLNTLVFAVLLFVNIKFSFFSGDKSFINNIDMKFFMSPYKILYVLNFVSLIFMTIFVIVQISSSTYGMKKKVVADYNIFVILIFIFMILHIFFFSQKRYAMASLYIFLSLVFNTIIYIKAQNMKKYMYNDEVRVFVYPFCMFCSWNLSMFLMTFNLMLNTKIEMGSSIFVIFAVIELILIIASSISVLFFYKDKIFIFIQSLYLIAVAIGTKLNDYFMPIGYLCFLSLVLILVSLYKFENRKK